MKTIIIIVVVLIQPTTDCRNPQFLQNSLQRHDLLDIEMKVFTALWTRVAILGEPYLKILKNFISYLLKLKPQVIQYLSLLSFPMSMSNICLSICLSVSIIRFHTFEYFELDVTSVCAKICNDQFSITIRIYIGQCHALTESVDRGYRIIENIDPFVAACLLFLFPGSGITPENQHSQLIFLSFCGTRKRFKMV